MAKRIDIPRDDLRYHLEAGLSYADIADKYGCSASTISKRVKEYGLDKPLESSENRSDDMSEDKKPEMGIGLDIGTMNLVSARKIGTSVETKRVRDAFLDLDIDAKKMLKLSGVSFIEYDDRILILGDPAIETANLFKREARRPLSQGLISSSEIDALEVLSILIEQVVGKPQEEGEVCYYSIPAAPLDMPGQDVVYHEAVFAKILDELGYDPISGNEAMAIIYSECASDNFSGIGISFGSGMVNCALSYMTMPIMEFSLARCLSKDFPIDTPSGMKPVSGIRPGDLVLGQDGAYTEVLEVFNNGHREELYQLQLEGLPFAPVDVTGDHKISVRRGAQWEWVAAQDAREGDIVGVPRIPYRGNHSSYYFCREDGQNVTVTKSRNLGRFLGMFLGDGSTCLYKNGQSNSGGRVRLAFNRKDAQLVQKYQDVINDLFGRFPSVVSRTEVEMDLINLEYHKIADHLKSKCYNGVGDKILPLPVHEIPDQMAVGVLEGLLDSDGSRTEKGFEFYNTSETLVRSMSHLLNRFGIWHTIEKRDPRQGGVNSRGVQIEGRKDSYTVRIRDAVAVSVLGALISKEGNSLRYPSGHFAERKVLSVETIPYDDDVYDISIGESHHAFATWGAVVHNCGDWIDQNASKAVGSTASRLCSIKEKGIDLTNPQSREEEALVVYYKSLIKYALDNIGKQFKNTQNDTELKEAIPIIVSGGTSLAGGFLDLFKEVFEKQRKRFPIEISEIRQADDPMTSVAQGLLVQSMQEYV